MSAHFYRRTLIRAVRAAVGQPRLGVEVGVWEGDCSLALLTSFPQLTLLMVDPWADTDDPTYANLHHERAFQRARLKTGAYPDRRVLWRATSQESAGLLTPVAIESLDFVFLDGSHLYESVRNDIAAWWPLIRPGGVLAGHDYETARWGVKQAVDEWSHETSQSVLLGTGRVWWAYKSNRESAKD